MPSIQFLQDFALIRTLADPRRLDILRRLMANPATLAHLGRAIGQHPAWVRHHLKQLEAAGLVELVRVQVSGGFVEKYYQATAQAFSVQQVILPRAAESGALVLMGSHDLALELLSQELLGAGAGLQLLALPVGSLEGLVALRQGFSHLTGCHLLDFESGEYNRSYVRHLLPDRAVSLVTLAHRQQGLLVYPGNPLGLHSLQDLGRDDVRLINRNRGSGTRLWLDEQLRRLGILPAQVRGYDREAPTHTGLAQAILAGQADVGLGLQAAASQAGLGFIPLFQERYDLVLPQEQVGENSFQVLGELLSGKDFHRRVEALPGYAASHTGELVPLHGKMP